MVPTSKAGPPAPLPELTLQDVTETSVRIKWNNMVCETRRETNGYATFCNDKWRVDTGGGEVIAYYMQYRKYELIPLNGYVNATTGSKEIKAFGGMNLYGNALPTNSEIHI